MTSYTEKEFFKATKDNAFPLVIQLEDPFEVLYETGMTLRDYFAAKAMQGMIARTNRGVEDDPSDISNEAYGYADAMIKAREK
jgi:hypothetical protein